MKLLRQLGRILESFKIPLLVLSSIVISLVFELIGFSSLSRLLLLAITTLGSYQLFRNFFISLWKRHFALDYIAVLAIIISLISGEYLVAAILALMITSGRTLEEYGVSQAKKSLTKLADRIPDQAIIWKNNHAGDKEKLDKIKVGQFIFIRKGEVIPLDGILISEFALIDESSITGEPYTAEKFKHDPTRSGTVNVGEPIVMRVSKEKANSAYEKIVEMVKKAQGEKAPLVRLADRYSTVFTIITLFIAAFAYVYSNDFKNVLAVLVIATPCPLLLATPIALLGGVNASARKRAIVKKLSSIEVLSRVNTMIFDKTGTITLGRPEIVSFERSTRQYTNNKLLSIAESIERNSLHPLAKAIVLYARANKAPLVHAEEIKERVGSGISGTLNGKKYTLKKLSDSQGMAIGIFEENKTLAVFRFEDEIKQESKQIIKTLKKLGLELYIFTGDKKEAAEKVVTQLGENVHIQAECTPEDKKKGIEELRGKGKVTAMVGDGINDAPALALADVGMVFSNEEQTAASEAADIVFLGGDFSLVLQELIIAKKTIRIALQSILWGIGLSVLGMVFASLGFIPPIFGAFGQEAIDVAVILNALRASR